MGRRQGARRAHPAPFYAPIWFSPAGTKMVRDVTDEQRSRRPIFIAPLWAGACWLFFRVARSTRMTQIWALRSRLEKQPTDLRQNTSYFGDRTLVGRGAPSSGRWGWDDAGTAHGSWPG